MHKMIKTLLCLLMILLMLLFPEPVKKGATEGLYLWYTSVVPILFPFIIFSNLLLAAGSFEFLSSPPRFRTKRKNRSNPWILYPLCFGLFCGFPMGAKTAGDLILDDKISEKEGKLIMPVANQASPMFITGYIGTHIFRNSIPVWKILFCLYVPAILFFLLNYIISLLKTNTSSTDHYSISKSLMYTSNSTQKNSTFRDTEHTIWNAFTIIVMIGIYMMIFTILTELCTTLLPANNILSLLLCTMEFSTGTARLKQLEFLTLSTRTALILALTSFGGFCTMFQSFGIVNNKKLSILSYLIRKMIIAVFVYLFSKIVIG